MPEQVEGYVNPDGSGRGDWSRARRPSAWWGALRALVTLAVLAAILDSLTVAGPELILVPLLPAAYLLLRAIAQAARP